MWGGGGRMYGSVNGIRVSIKFVKDLLCLINTGLYLAFLKYT